MSTTSDDGIYLRTATLQDSYPGRADDARRDVYVLLERDGLDVVTMAYTAQPDEEPSRVGITSEPTWDAGANEARALNRLSVEVMLTARAELDDGKYWHDTVPTETTVENGQAAIWLAEL